MTEGPVTKDAPGVSGTLLPDGRQGPQLSQPVRSDIQPLEERMLYFLPSIMYVAASPLVLKGRSQNGSRRWRDRW